jgi:hypothetical protein
LTGIFYPPNKRYRLYIDETGTDSMKSTEIDRHLALMGVVLRQDTHDNGLHPRLEAIKTDLFGHCPIKNPVILHRSEIVRLENAFVALNDPEIEQEFNSRFLSIVSETSYRAMAVAIDKHAHFEKYTSWQYNPYHYCLELMLERFCQWLERNNYYGDVVIEARSKNKDKRLKEAYSHFYNKGNDWCKTDIVQTRLLSKQPKFKTKKDNISALQLADLLAQPVHRFMKSQKLKETVNNDFGQSLVTILRREKFFRNPDNHNRIWGWGLKWLP